MKKNVIIFVLVIYSIVVGAFLILYAATANYLLNREGLIYPLALALIGLSVFTLMYVDKIKFNIHYLLIPLIMIYVMLLHSSDTLNTLFFELPLLTEIISFIPIGLYIIYFIDKNGNKNNADNNKKEEEN